MTGDWHKICTEEYETAEAESFGALAGWCYGKGEIPPKLTEALNEALRAAFAGAFDHGYEACVADPPAALSAPSEPVPADRAAGWHEAIAALHAMPVLPGRFGLGADGNIEDLVHTVLGAAEQYLRETCPGGPWEPSEGSDE